jgi:hypothetical protein
MQWAVLQVPKKTLALLRPSEASPYIMDTEGSWKCVRTQSGQLVPATIQPRVSKMEIRAPAVISVFLGIDALINIG